METKSFTNFSHNTMKDELINLNENQLNALENFMLKDLLTIWKQRT